VAPASFFALASSLENPLPRPWAATKTAEINTGPRTFFVYARLPEHIASSLRELQGKLIPDAAKHQDIDHVTLVMVKKPSGGGEHEPEKAHAAIDALKDVGAATEPISARLQGFAYFDAADRDGKKRTALVALVNAPGLERLHVDAARALEEHGLEPADNHGFTAHATIGYLTHGGRVDDLPLLSGSFMIDKVHVAARDHHEIPLTGASALAKAASDFVMNTRDLRREPKNKPGKGETSAVVDSGPVQGGAMSSGGGLR
jgi:2'-5' RNA ligase